MRRINQKSNPYKPKKPRLLQVIVIFAAGVTFMWLSASILHITNKSSRSNTPNNIHNIEVNHENRDDKKGYVTASSQEVDGDLSSQREIKPDVFITSVSSLVDSDVVLKPPLDSKIVTSDEGKSLSSGLVEAGTPKTDQTSNCPPGRKPYHVLLTAQSSNYQNWQARIMYFHFKKQQRSNPCTEMVNFTRLVATKDGKPDGLENEIPSIFTTARDERELAEKYGSFGVLNRPTSVVELVRNRDLWEGHFKEDYIFVAETDHVFFKDIPNMATETMPAGYKFGYMRQNPSFNPIIQRHWPEGSWDRVDQTGPSPLIIHKRQLEKVAEPWLKFSLALKRDPQADKSFGWVLEMWGYTIAAASVGIKHTIIDKFQIEPANLNHLNPDFWKEYYIFHYTYGIEYTMEGEPMMNTIGEWSLDKRHYGASYPPRNLQLPPRKNKAATNAAAFWLTNAFNEATAGIPDWPTFPTLGTVGWRRESISHAEIQKYPIAKEIMGKHWSWSGVNGLKFMDNGKLITPWGEGKWGVRLDEFNCPEDKRDRCVFADFANSSHNLLFDSETTFISKRVGDGEIVKGLLSQVR